MQRATRRQELAGHFVLITLVCLTGTGLVKPAGPGRTAIILRVHNHPQPYSQSRPTSLRVIQEARARHRLRNRALTIAAHTGRRAATPGLSQAMSVAAAGGLLHHIIFVA
jgi:hypothetical protein